MCSMLEQSYLPSEETLNIYPNIPRHFLNFVWILQAKGDKYDGVSVHDNMFCVMAWISTYIELFMRFRRTQGEHLV